MAQAEHVSSAIAALRIGASARASTKLVRPTYAELASVATHPLRLVALNPHWVDLADAAADHMVFKTLWAYLTAIPDDPVQNIPGGLDVCQIGCALQYAAAKPMAWRAA
jgi:hypothetical protein